MEHRLSLDRLHKMNNLSKRIIQFFFWFTIDFRFCIFGLFSKTIQILFLSLLVLPFKDVKVRFRECLEKDGKKKIPKLIIVMLKNRN